MKKSIFCSIVFAALCLLCAARPTQAQTIYGYSEVGYDSSARYVWGYSSTWTDYYAAWDYDPEVHAILFWQYDNEIPLAEGHDVGYSDPYYGYQIAAEVYNESSAYRSSTTYEEYSTHLVRPYYSYSYCFDCWYDPYGFSMWGNSFYGGYYPWPNYFYDPYFYVSGRSQVVGRLRVFITTPPSNQCSAGASFDENGNACPNPSPSPTPIASPTPQLQVDEVGFTNDYPITRWSDGHFIDQPDGSESTWVRTRAATENDTFPVAYKMGTGPTVFAKLTVASNPSNTQTADIRVKSGSTVLGSKTGVSLAGGSIRVENIAISSTLESSAGVKKSTYSFTWEASYNGGQSWTPIGTSGSHIIYWTYSDPLGPPFSDSGGATYSPLYDLALEKSAGKAGGASDLPTIISRINTGVDSELEYDPSFSLGAGHPLRVYDPTILKCLCADNAHLLRGLLRSVGIDGTVKWYWGGSGATRYYYTYNDPSYGPYPVTFRVLRGAHDKADENPHFTYHAIVLANGLLYDPSYGISYPSLNFDETFSFATGTFTEGTPAANANQVISDSYFPYAEQRPVAACPHPTPVPTPDPTPDPIDPCWGSASGTMSSSMSRPVCY